MARGNVVDHAWAAGFLDGEGHFGAKARLRNGQYIWITATQTATRAPLDRLREMYGGSICYVNEKRPRQRGRWQWRLDGAPAVRRAIPHLLPHLTVKAEEARVLLEIATITPGRGQRLTADVAARRVLLSGRLRELRAA